MGLLDFVRHAPSVTLRPCDPCNDALDRAQTLVRVLVVVVVLVVYLILQHVPSYHTISFLVNYDRLFVGTILGSFILPTTSSFLSHLVNPLFLILATKLCQKLHFSAENFMFITGKFEDLTHSVGGDIFVLDDKTIYIQVRFLNSSSLILDP